MSEYTNYFIVKSSSEEEVRNELNSKEIVSVVNADQSDFWFADKYKRGGKYKWVTITTPGSLQQLKAIFDTVVLFFQDENFMDWRITLTDGNEFIEKVFTSTVITEFSDNDKMVLSSCFEKPFDEIESFLQSGKAAEFLNLVGIPYMEMNDQSLLSLQITDGQYSFLSEELW
jgi:hypothetical protein